MHRGQFMISRLMTLLSYMIKNGWLHGKVFQYLYHSASADNDFSSLQLPLAL